MDGWMVEWLDGWKDGRKEARKERRTDGRMDELSCCIMYEFVTVRICEYTTVSTSVLTYAYTYGRKWGDGCMGVS